MVDRREALKKLGVGGGVALGAPLVLDGFLNRASASGGCIQPTLSLINAGQPSTISGGSFTVTLQWPSSAEPPYVRQGPAVINGTVLKVTPGNWQTSTHVQVVFARNGLWCGDFDADGKPAWTKPEVALHLYYLVTVGDHTVGGAPVEGSVVTEDPNHPPALFW